MQNRLPALALAAAMLLCAPLPAAAQETQPGDACTAGELHHMRQSSGPENPGTGYFLVCDGANWKLITEWDTTTGSSLFQVDYDSGACDALKLARLRYTSASKLWEYCDGATWSSLGSASAAALNDLIDVNILSAADQEVLTYDSASGTWASAPSAVDIFLNEVSDVNAPVPTAGQVLKWSGSAWIADTDEGGESLWSNSGAGYIEYGLAGTGIKVEATAAASPTFWGLSDLTDHTANQNIRMSGFWLSNDGGNEGVFVDTNGNVGIGAAPESSHILRVATRTNASTEGLSLTSPNGGWIKLLPDMGNGNYGPLPQAGDTGLIFSDGTADTGGLVIAPWGSGGPGLRMDNLGNVGIGTASPQDALHISKGTTGAAAARFTNSATGTTSGDGLQVGLNVNQVHAYVWNYENGYLSFGTNNQERISILGNGDVGIGTTGPQAKFNVSGGSALFNTATDSNPLIIGRGNDPSKETLKIGITDNVANFHYNNDESAASINFRIENTDTESGGGANANDNVVMTIRGDTTGGKIGIRTASPLDTLDINKGHIFSTGGSLHHLFNNYWDAAQSRFEYAGYDGGSKYAAMIAFEYWSPRLSHN